MPATDAPTDAPVLSLPTLRLCRQLLGNTTLQVGAPDFQTVAPQVITGLAELDASITAMEAADPEGSAKPTP